MGRQANFRKQKPRRIVVLGGRDFDNVTLTCGHPAPGLPKISNPDGWFCPECRAWKRRGR